MQVAIVGAGNFGTAIANIVGRNLFPTLLWMRDSEQLADIEAHGENLRYLPGHPLAPSITPTTDLAAAVAASDVVFMTVPSGSFRSVTAEVARHISGDTMLVSGTKGIEADGFHLMSQILDELLPDCPTGVISGPNLAEEMADGQYTGTVVASESDLLCDRVQELLRSETFRVYKSHDVFGVELGGALKNIYAIICGMGAGLGVGQNTVGMLITRSLAEMSRFAASLGANPFTFLGLAGVGDLVVTCTSPLSRNFRVGFKIAEGASLEGAIAEVGLAEGVNTLKVIKSKSDALGVYMPLVDALHSVLFERQEIGDAVMRLMTAAQAVDVEFANPETWSATS